MRRLLVGCRCAPRASRADADGHVWQDADRRAARSVDRRGRQDARMAERFAARLPAPTWAADALIAGAYLAGTNTRRVRRALNAVFAGPVGKDVVSRVWRKTKGDWDAWNGRSLADERIVRLILDGTVARSPARQKGDLDLLLRGARRARRRPEDAARDQEHGREGEAAWRALLDDQLARIANAGAGRHRRRAGFEKAVAALWPDMAVQRCTVHKSRVISSPTRPSACTRKSRTTTAT